MWLQLLQWLPGSKWLQRTGLAPATRADRPSRSSAVLLDLGGVFLDWDPRHLYRKLFGDDVAAMEDFLTNVCTPAWHAEQDLGQGIARPAPELSPRYPEYADLITAWAERNEEMVKGVIDGSVAVLAELSTGRRRALRAHATWNGRAGNAASSSTSSSSGSTVTSFPPSRASSSRTRAIQAGLGTLRFEPGRSPLR